MSPIGDGGWRIRYLGPWTWIDDMGGWDWPRRRWGWRLVVTTSSSHLDFRDYRLVTTVHDKRLDLRGPLLDVIEAAAALRNQHPADLCDRCLPGLDEGERIPIYLPGETPCEHTRSDR